MAWGKDARNCIVRDFDICSSCKHTISVCIFVYFAPESLNSQYDTKKFLCAHNFSFYVAFFFPSANFNCANKIHPELRIKIKFSILSLSLKFKSRFLCWNIIYWRNRKICTTLCYYLRMYRPLHFYSFNNGRSFQQRKRNEYHLFFGNVIYFCMWIFQWNWKRLKFFFYFCRILLPNRQHICSTHFQLFIVFVFWNVTIETSEKKKSKKNRILIGNCEFQIQLNKLLFALNPSEFIKISFVQYTRDNNKMHLDSFICNKHSKLLRIHIETYNLAELKFGWVLFGAEFVEFAFCMKFRNLIKKFICDFLLNGNEHKCIVFLSETLDEMLAKQKLPCVRIDEAVWMRFIGVFSDIVTVMAASVDLFYSKSY